MRTKRFAVALSALLVVGCFAKAVNFPRVAGSEPPEIQISADPPETEPYLKGTVRSRSTMYRQYYSPTSLEPLLVVGLFMNAGAAQPRTQQQWSALQGFFSAFDVPTVAEAAISTFSPATPTGEVPPVSASATRVIARPFLLLQEGSGRLLYGSVVLQAEFAGQAEKKPWKGLYSYHIPMAISASAVINQSETVDATAYGRLVEKGVQRVLDLLYRDTRGELPWSEQRRAFVETKEFLGFPLGAGAGYDVVLVEETEDDVVLRFPNVGGNGVVPGGVHILQRGQMDSFLLR